MHWLHNDVAAKAVVYKKVGVVDLGIFVIFG
jgi:hypothetical protein